MNPVLKRILLHGGLTAGLLALVGLLFAEMAGMWAGAGATTPSRPAVSPPCSRIRLTTGFMSRPPNSPSNARYL